MCKTACITLCSTKCKTLCNNMNSFALCTPVRAMSCNNTFRDLKLCIKPTLSNAISTEQRWIEWIWSFVQSIWNLFVYSSSLCHRSDFLFYFFIFSYIFSRHPVFETFTLFFNMSSLCHRSDLQLVTFDIFAVSCTASPKVFAVALCRQSECKFLSSWQTIFFVAGDKAENLLPI